MPTQVIVKEAARGVAGASAYERALANGFVGTEAQWLASLEGPMGPQGTPGLAGPQGNPGLQGPEGPPGADGNTILYGTVAPGAGQGQNGDFYIKTADAPDPWFIYGPKAGGVWPAGIELTGGGSGPPPPPTDLSTSNFGVNNIDLAYFNRIQPFNNIQHADWIYYRDASNNDVILPDANRDALGFGVWPPPAGGTKFAVAIDPVSNPRPFTIQFDGPVATLTILNATGISYDLANNRAHFTPFDQASNGSGFNYTLAANGDHPHYTILPDDDDGSLLNPDYVERVQAVTAPNGPIRFMKWSNAISRGGSPVNFSTVKFPNDGDGQLGEVLITAANRNKPGSADWVRGDGVPHEVMADVCRVLDRPAYVNLPYNTDWDHANTYHPDVAPVWVSFAQDTGKQVFLEFVNELWEFGSQGAHQLYNEANFLGITMEERYAQICTAVFAPYIAAFTAAGIRDQLVCVAAWQNFGNPAVSGPLFLSGFAFDGLFVAPYYGDDPDIGFAASYTGAYLPVIAASYPTVDGVLTASLAWKTWGAANGVPVFGFYESGPTWNFSDLTFKTTLNRSAEAHDLEAYFNDQIAFRFGRIPAIFFALGYPIVAGNGFAWGLFENMQDPIDLAHAPKGMANKEAVEGKVTLQDLQYSSLSIATDALDGAFLGAAPTRQTSGTTYSVVDNDGGRITVNPATGRPSVLDHTVLGPVDPARDFTVRQVNINAINSPRDQVVPYAITATFDPATLSPLYWIEPVDPTTVFEAAADAAEDADRIFRVTGKGGTPNFEQATLGNRPQFLTAGYPGADYDNAAVRYLVPAAEVAVGDANGQRWGMMVLKMNSNAEGQENFNLFGTVNMGGVKIGFDGTTHNVWRYQVFYNNDGSQILENGPVVDTTQPVVIIWELTSTGANLSALIEQDGVAGTPTAVSAAPDHGLTKPYLGGDPLYSGASMQAKLFAFIMGSGTLTGGQKANLRTYGAALVGRTL